MTEAAAVVRVGVRRLAIAVSADTVAAATLTCLCVLFAALTWGTWGDVRGDTGYDLVAGSRVAAGELPYVDFVYYYGPLAPLLLGLASFVGGSGVGPFVALGVTLAAAIVLATYALGRLLLEPLGAFLAAALVVPAAFGPGVFNFVLPHSYSASLGALALLLGLLGLGRYAVSAHIPWLTAAGICCGAVALTRPEYGLAVAVAVVLWCSLAPQGGDGGGRRLLVHLVAPAVLVPVLVYGAFALATGPKPLLLENLYPVEELNAAGSHLLGLQAPLTGSSVAKLALYLALYAAGAALLAFVARLAARRDGIGRTALAGLAVAAVAGLGAAAARPGLALELLKVSWGWIPAGAALTVPILLIRFRRTGARAPQDQVALLVTVALAVLAAKTYAAFLVYATVVQMAVYAAPLAAIFLARLHLVELARSRSAALVGAGWLCFLAVLGGGVTLRDARAESATVSGPGGTLAAKPAEARAYREALRWIEASTPVGAPVLLAPQLTALYTISDRTNPLPQLSLLPGALSDPSEERAAIALLDERAVPLVIVDNRPFTEYGHEGFGVTFDVLLADWLQRDYRRVARLQTGVTGAAALDIWLRRNR